MKVHSCPYQVREPCGKRNHQCMNITMWEHKGLQVRPGIPCIFIQHLHQKMDGRMGIMTACVTTWVYRCPRWLSFTLFINNNKSNHQASSNFTCDCMQFYLQTVCYQLFPARFIKCMHSDETEWSRFRGYVYVELKAGLL